MIEPIINALLRLKAGTSIFTPRSATSFLLSRLIPIIITDNTINTIPIRFKKGILGNQNLNRVESGIVSKAVINAALAVALFQNIPKKKIANTPGVTKLEYSWMNC